MKIKWYLVVLRCLREDNRDSEVVRARTEASA